MKVIFIPGFLGQATDFDHTVAQLKKILPMDAECVHVDLFEGVHPAGLVKNPSDWIRNFFTWLNDIEPDSEKVSLVGYSMGGRLALMLTAELARSKGLNFYRTIALSANPGYVLESAVERADWRHSWLKRFAENPWLQALEAWNDQPVFAGSKARGLGLPESAREKVLWALEHYDYQTLPLKPADLNSVRDRLSFLFGERDAKYKEVKAKVEVDFGTIACAVVANAGHRLPFDQPSNTAIAIAKILNLNAE